jgi:hypothetical protein
VAAGDRTLALIAHLNRPDQFATLHRVPTLSADEEDFNPETGYYWQGAVWAPTNTMVIRGLEKQGYSRLARIIAINHLKNLVTVFNKTGTIWENYAPQKIAPGDPAKKDFVGWSGIGAVMYLLEYAVGLKPNAPEKHLTWNITSTDRVGCTRFWFAGITTSLLCEAPEPDGYRAIRLTTDKPYSLTIKLGKKTKKLELTPGKTHELTIQSPQ